MKISLKGILRTLGEPFEAIGKFVGHSAREVGKVIGKNPALLAVLPIAFPALKAAPLIGGLFGALGSLTQPSPNNPTAMALNTLLPWLVLSQGREGMRTATALMLPQILSQQGTSPTGLFTTLLLLSALEEPKPITPAVFSPLTPQQVELLNKAIALAMPPTVTVSPVISPTVTQPFRPFQTF